MHRGGGVLAPKRIYKLRRGLDHISVLPKSSYVRILGRDKAVIWRILACSMRARSIR